MLLFLVLACTPDSSDSGDSGDMTTDLTYVVAHTTTGDYVDLHRRWWLRADGTFGAWGGESGTYASVAERFCSAHLGYQDAPVCTIHEGLVSAPDGPRPELEGAQAVAVAGLSPNSWGATHEVTCAAGPLAGSSCVGDLPDDLVENGELLAVLPTALDVVVEDTGIALFVLDGEGGVSTCSGFGCEQWGDEAVRLFTGGLALDGSGSLWSQFGWVADDVSAASGGCVAQRDGHTEFGRPDPGEFDIYDGPRLPGAATQIGCLPQRGQAIVDGDLWLWSIAPEDFEVDWPDDDWLTFEEPQIVPREP